MLRARTNDDCFAFKTLHCASSWPNMPNISDLSILSEPVPLGYQEQEEEHIQHATQWLPKPSYDVHSKILARATYQIRINVEHLLVPGLQHRWSSLLWLVLICSNTIMTWHALCVLHMALINHAYLYCIHPSWGVQSNWTISHFFNTVPFFNFILIFLKVFLLSAEQWIFCLAIESSRVYTIGCTEVAHEPSPKKTIV